MNKAILVTISFAICMACGVSSEEEDYHLPPRTRPTPGFLHHGNTFPVPLSRPKYVERYFASDIHLFGGGGGEPPKRFRQPHPNQLPQLNSKETGYELIRAPVIYSQTVTNTDPLQVGKAINNAFTLIDALKKKKTGISTSMPVPSPPTVENNNRNVITNVEFVNHIAPGTKGTTTTTIVEAPQEIEVVRPMVAQSPVVLKSSGLVQFPPIPSAHDLPPLQVSLATSAPLTKQAVVPVVPATTTSTSPATFVTPPAVQSPSPRLIIPSQSHLTTLAEAVQNPADPQVRTIIQPVYIPYPVDKNGRPVGPLPDYHTMDFGAILSAQNKLIVQDAPQPQPTPAQVIQEQPTPQAPVQYIQEVQQPTPAQVQYIQEQQPTPGQVQYIQEQQPTPAQVQYLQEQQPTPGQVQLPQEQVLQQPQQQVFQQQYHVQTDQVTAGDTTSSDDAQAPVLPKRRIVRRRKKARRNNPARRI